MGSCLSLIQNPVSETKSTYIVSTEIPKGVKSTQTHHINEEDDLRNTNENELSYFSFEGKRFKAKPCNIYDGDTFSILFLYNGILMKYRCRCLGYDTPEMKPSLKNPNREKEKEMAKKAKERFIELLGKGKDGLVEVECFEFDKKAMAAAEKNEGNAEKLAKITSHLKEVEKNMKHLAEKWKQSEGEEKENILNKLKEKTKIKKELKALQDKYAESIV